MPPSSYNIPHTRQDSCLLILYLVFLSPISLQIYVDKALVNKLIEGVRPTADIRTLSLLLSRCPAHVYVTMVPGHGQVRHPSHTFCPPWHSRLPPFLSLFLSLPGSLILRIPYSIRPTSCLPLSGTSSPTVLTSMRRMRRKWKRGIQTALMRSMILSLMSTRSVLVALRCASTRQ